MVHSAAISPAPVVRYVDERTCLNSIIVSSIACAVSITFAAALFRRAFAEALGHQFITSDSAIRFMTMRCRLLFFAAVLNAVDAASNVVQWVIMLQGTHLVDFVLVRVVFMVSLVAALPLQTYATCQRCAVIVAREHTKRTRLLNTAFRTCVVSFVVMESGVAYNLVVMISAGEKTTVQDWLTVLYMPPPVVVFMAIMPFLIMFSSIWALSVNVRRANHQSSSGSLPSSPGSMVSGSTRHQSTSGVEHRTSITAASSVAATPHSSVLGHTNSVYHPPSRKPNSPSASAIASMMAPAAAAASLASLLRSRSKSFLNRAPASHLASRSQLSYPLSTSFTILTIAIIVLWCIGLTATLFPIFPSVRRSPVNAIVNALCLAFEASFERLLKLAKHNHHRRQNRKAVAASAFQGDEEDENGLGQGHGMSVSGVGSWTMGTRLGHGPGDAPEPAVKEDLDHGTRGGESRVSEDHRGGTRPGTVVATRALVSISTSDVPSQG